MQLLAWTPRDELVSIEGRFVVIREASTGAVVTRWPAHGQAPSVSAAASDASMIFTAISAQSVLWAVDGRVLGKSRRQHAFERKAAFAAGTLFTFWRSFISQASLPDLHEFTSTSASFNAAASVAVAPDGTWGVIGGQLGNLTTFGTRSHSARDHHDGPVTVVHVSTDRVISATSKGPVLVSRVDDDFSIERRWRPTRPVSALCTLRTGERLYGDTAGTVFVEPRPTRRRSSLTT